MRLLVWIALAALAHAGTATAGALYRWVDEQGTVHFSDRAPDGGAERIELEAINAVAPVRRLEEPDGPSAGEEPQTGPSRVTMYSTSWCGYCKQAREYVRAEGIPFTEHDIEASTRARRAYDRLGGGGVPLLKVGDRTMNGFSVPGFARFYWR